MEKYTYREVETVYNDRPDLLSHALIADPYGYQPMLAVSSALFTQTNGVIQFSPLLPANLILRVPEPEPTGMEQGKLPPWKR